jgi:hypothetical protein
MTSSIGIRSEVYYAPPENLIKTMKRSAALPTCFWVSEVEIDSDSYEYPILRIGRLSSLHCTREKSRWYVQLPSF